jgi:hypothetical protein
MFPVRYELNVCVPYGSHNKQRDRNRMFKRSFRAEVSAGCFSYLCTSSAMAARTKADLECKHS